MDHKDVRDADLTRMAIAKCMISIYQAGVRNTHAMSGKEEGSWDSHAQIDALEDELRKTLHRFGEEFDVHPYTMAGLLQLLMVELVDSTIVFDSDIDPDES
jgi:hypothetical protein